MQHPVVRFGHHSSSGKGVLTATTQTTLRSSRASSSFSSSPTPPGLVRADRETQTARKACRLEFPSLICARDGVFCVLARVWADLTVSSHSASSTSNILADLRWLCRHSAVYQSCANLSLPLSLEVWVPHHICFSLISETISVHGLILRGTTAASARAGMMFNMKVEPLHAGARFHHRITTGSLAQLPLSDQSKQLLRSHFHTH